jgi:triosephosphate isomerase
LKDFGCTYVLVGHSERRAIYGESNEDVASRFEAAQSAGLVPVLCVGETIEQRETGLTEEVVAGQIDAILARSGVSAFEQAIVAYEPVWAIGTGHTASPEQAQAVAGRLRILYGGSVKGSNATELFAQADIDGGLVGGASLTVEDFLAICRCAD